MILKGKTALVTGSNGGIGFAFATAFAKEGANIVLNGPASKDEVGQLLAGIRDAGVQCIYSPADVGKPAEIESMIREAEREFGAVDVLVNNAVVRYFHPVEKFPPEEWDRALAINVSAAFHTIRLALPGMKQRNWGRIINLGSIHSERAREQRIDYITAKHAIIGITKTVAIETARTGITCNALAPGWVLTPHSERQIADEMAQSACTRDEAISRLLALRQPSRRFVTKEEVAALAVFLCSDAAANITGAMLPIDGGWSAAS